MNLDPIGRNIRIDRWTFKVAGVTKAKRQDVRQSQDRFVTVPIRNVLEVLAGARLVRDRGRTSTNRRCRSRSRRRNIMRSAPPPAPRQADKFGVTTRNGFELYRTLTGGIFILTIGVAAISKLIVGGIVIMNEHHARVRDGTDEGDRRAQGARAPPRHPHAVPRGVHDAVAFGGLIGIALGAGSRCSSAVSPLPAAVSLPAVILGVPRARASVFLRFLPGGARRPPDPIEALRYE